MAESSDVLGLTAQIVSAHVSNNSVTPDALPSLIQEVYRTLAGVDRATPAPDNPQPGASMKWSVFADEFVGPWDRKN
jgi:predicted transcriptional regulator